MDWTFAHSSGTNRTMALRGRRFHPLRASRRPRKAIVPLRRGFLMLELACSAGLVVVMLGITAVSIGHIANQRRALLQECLAEQAVANTIEQMDAQPLKAIRPGLQADLPEWVQDQFPQAAMHVKLGHTNVIGLRPLTVTLSWQPAAGRPPTTYQQVYWKAMIQSDSESGDAP